MALAIDSNNDLTLTDGQFDSVTGLEALGQRVRDRLFTMRNEWFLDTEFGVPYLESILGQKPRSLVGISAILKTEIRLTLGTDATLSAFQVAFDSTTRELSVAFLIVDAAGAELAENFIL